MLELLVGGTPTARQGLVDFYLFARVVVVLHVADVDHTTQAAVRPQALEASVVSVEGVVGVGVRYSTGVHSESPFLWARSRGVASTCGAILFPTSLFYRII